MNVVFDAGPLITACKFEVKGKLVIDHLITGCKILIPPSVEEEVAILGARYMDGMAAGQRIADGKILVISININRWEPHLYGYSLGDGERDCIELCGQEPTVQALVTDDHIAFIAATRLGLKVWMLPDLVVALGSRGKLKSNESGDILEAIRPRYRTGVIEYSIEKLREVEKNAKSSSTN